MKSTSCTLPKFFLSILSFIIIFFSSNIMAYAQGGPYSTKAQEFLDTYSGDNLDVFKFSINNILNSVGDTVKNTNGDPTIFGRTDYGSEFFLENELNTTSSIEIPAFAIDDLAEISGNYLPVIRNGAIDLLIDFKDLYDTKDGLAITPEMGFVKLVEPTGSVDYPNLIDGDILEFFVDPSDAYRKSHNSDNLFFIDRPIPENPVVLETDAGATKTSTVGSSSSGTEGLIYVEPGEEAVTLPSGEVKIYVTSVYVPAPASKFKPAQIVMPVLADGDYNYEIEPGPAETFSDDVQVVAIPDEESKIISEKVKAIKAAKAKSQKYKRERELPALDAELEPLIALQKLDIENQKSSSRLLSDAKKNIRKNFPNLSNELIDLVINLANPDEKFDFIRDPKEILDKEFSNLSNPSDLNQLLSGNLSQKELKKIYNLILYKFSTDLAELGFETFQNKEFNFSNKVLDPDKILDQVQLQEDIMAIAFLLRFYNDDQNLSNLLIGPMKVKPDSSTALFQSDQSQKTLSQIKSFSKVINSINNLPRTIPVTQDLLDSDIPIIELNVGVRQNIVKALQEKLTEDKRLNRSFQPLSQGSKLQNFNFEPLPQNESSALPASRPLLAEAPNITDQELQLVSETTEATNNILDDTVAKMLKELGAETPKENSAQLVSVTNSVALLEQQYSETNETIVFNNALSTVQRLQEIEDIRAIFQILGIGY